MGGITVTGGLCHSAWRFFCFCGIRAGVDARSASVPQAVQLLGSPHAMGGRGALGYMSACGRTCLSAAWGVERQGARNTWVLPLAMAILAPSLVPVAHRQQESGLCVPRASRHRVHFPFARGALAEPRGLGGFD